MPARFSITYDHFRSIPLTLVMVLTFVLQAVAIVGLVNYQSDGYWEFGIYGLILLLSIGFGWIMAYWVSRSYESVESALKESQERYKVLFQTLPIGVSITDKDANIIERNAASEKWLGNPSPSEFDCLQKHGINPNVLRADGSIMPVEEYACVRAFKSNQAVCDVETGIICVDGILRWFSISASPIPLEQYGVVIVHVDISDRKFAEDALKESEARFLKIATISPEAIYILVRHPDGNTFFEYASPASEELLGLRVENLKSYPNLRHQIFHPDDLAGFEREIELSLKTMQMFQHEWRIITPQGQTKWIKSQAMPERRANGDVAWYGFAFDISDRKQSEIALIQIEADLKKANQELKRLVNIDGLTQIANRRCFDERIFYEWQRLYREKQPLSLLMFDVDYFKRYNDYYGQQLGDECLLRIAQAVDQLVGRPADLVARYGGEEFIVILPNTNLEGAIIVAKMIHQVIVTLQIPHQASDVSGVVTISMGITSDIPNLERSPYLLINQADQALYYAKYQGRNRSVVFTN